MSSGKSNLEKFLWGIFGDSHDADGFYSEYFDRLSEVERQEAERKILEALEVTEDPRPIDAARFMNLKAAAPILKQRIARGSISDFSKVSAAQALFAIEKWDQASQIIISVLRDAPMGLYRRIIRSEAIHALADFGKDPATLPVIFMTTEDEDNNIARGAIVCLKKIYAKDEKIYALLDDLHKLLISPYYNAPESLNKRSEILKKLEKLTGITMPEVHKRQRNLILRESTYPEKQMPLF